MWHLEVISHIKTIYLLITHGLSDTDDEVFLRQTQVSPCVVWMTDDNNSGVLVLDLYNFTALHG